VLVLVFLHHPHGTLLLRTAILLTTSGIQIDHALRKAKPLQQELLSRTGRSLTD
jgi:hypothetical protein